jgi:hypothetical protein
MRVLGSLRIEKETRVCDLVSRTSNLCGAGFSRTTLPFCRSNLRAEKRGSMFNLRLMNSVGGSVRFFPSQERVEILIRQRKRS